MPAVPSNDARDQPPAADAARAAPVPAPRRRRLGAGIALAAALACAAAPAVVRGEPVQGFGAEGGAPAAPWRLALLPKQTKPVTGFRVVQLDGVRALRVEAQSSYGNVLHPLDAVAVAPSARLAWRWRVELSNDKTDLRERGGDDTTLKVCTLWDEPIEQLPFTERQLLRIARGAAGEPVPAATVCYVWDANLPEGTVLDSPFTHRLRYLVLHHAGAAGWAAESRDIAADFLRLFGGEAHQQLPPLVGVAVGADADNTQGHSIGFVTDLKLSP